MADARMNVAIAPDSMIVPFPENASAPSGTSDKGAAAEHGLSQGRQLGVGRAGQRRGSDLRVDASGGHELVHY
jgi:hypothetical protein